MTTNGAASSAISHADVADFNDQVDVAAVAAAFADVLHRSGLAVSSEQTARYAAAVGGLVPGTVSEMYWIARTTLIGDRVDYARFDALFDQIFGGLIDDARRGDTNQPDISTYERSAQPPTQRPAGALQSADGQREGRRNSQPDMTHDDRDDDGSERLQVTTSSTERLAAHAFDACTPDELATLGRLIAGLTLHPPKRRSRRRRRHHAGSTHDMRATLRRAHRTGGDPVRVVLRAREMRSRQVVLLCDVSGSMEAFARAYLYLLHAAVRSTRAEAFVFSTQLTRVTTALRHHQPEIALVKASAECTDWSGGTRIAGAIGAFLDEWGRRGIARGAVVVIVSDGWESGDPALLAEQMDRLSRLAHRIVWVNPRKRSADYRPLVAGMAAALPYVDRFVSGHSYEALLEVVEVIGEP